MKQIHKRGVTYGFLFVGMVMVILQTLTYLTQVSADNLAVEYNFSKQNIPLGNNTFITSYGIKNPTNDSETILNENKVASILPSTAGGIVSAIGTFFFPIIIFLQWILGSLGNTGSFIYGFIFAVPHLLQSIGLPAAVSMALGVMYMLFAVASLIIGILK
jgi:hypothetical protein